MRGEIRFLDEERYRTRLVRVTLFLEQWVYDKLMEIAVRNGCPTLEKFLRKLAEEEEVI